MKKIIAILAAVFLLAAMAPAALAAGSAYLSGPGEVRAGDTITVSFAAGGGIFGGSGSVAYDPAQLTLQGYSASIGGSWAVEFSGDKFVFYDNTMSSPIEGSKTIFKATFTVNASLEPGTVITVKASGVTLSDGKQDMSGGSPSYSATVLPPLSDNCRLASLVVENAQISPAFSADVLEYSASVPYEVSSLSVSAGAEHPNAKVAVDNPSLKVAGTTKVKVTVTAENGTAQTYVIQVYRAQDPNYVPSSNANLSALSVEGYPLSPVFSADVTQYYVWLPYEAETVSFTAAVEDSRAEYAIGEISSMEPGKGTDIPVTVTAEDGTQKVYTVTAVRAPAHEDVDRFLNGEREPESTVPPDTKPETEPTTRATTEPEPTEGQQKEDPAGASLKTLILVGILCALAGAAIGAAVVLLIRKKAE